jgi:hypothetical protein
MRKPDPSVLVWSLIALGCGRSEQSIKAEFAAYVGGANQCQVAADCAVASPGCPLGCFVAVRSDRKADVENEARSLIQSYQAGGAGCAYDCVVPGPVTCTANRCAVAADGGGPVPTATLSFDPVDGTTNTATRALTVKLYPSGIVSEQVLATLPLKIETWPEHEIIPSHLLPPLNVGQQMGVQIVPDSPLLPRWYALRLGSLPPSTVFSLPLEGGVIGARFRPDPFPLVRSLQLCDKAPPGMKLLLQFSEPTATTMESGHLVTVQIDGQAADCPLYWAQPDGLYFTCDALTPTSKLKVVLAAGLTGASGAALPPGSWEVDVSKLPAGSCREYRAPL